MRLVFLSLDAYRVLLFALCVPAFGQTGAPIPPTPCPRLADLELEFAAADPPTAEHASSSRVEHTVDFAGSLHVFTVAENGADLALRIESSDGTLVAEDEDSGGGTTAYVRIEVQPDRRFTIVVTAKDGAGRAIVRMFAAPETDATRLAAADSRAARKEIAALTKGGDSTTARKLVTELVEKLCSLPGGACSDLVAREADQCGYAAYSAALPKLAVRAWSFAEEHLRRVFPDTHKGLRDVRGNLATMLYSLGDYVGARAALEEVLASAERAMPEEHPDVQALRNNLSAVLHGLGDLPAARALQERVLAVRLRTLDETDPDVALSRAQLAGTLSALGYEAEARVLQEQVLAVAADRDPVDEFELAQARGNLAATIKEQGEVDRARLLEEQALAVLARTLPEDHPQLVTTRLNHGITLSSLGDLAGARELQERVLAVVSRTLPSSHPQLQLARACLADTLGRMGEPGRARVLIEESLAVREKSLPANDSALLGDRQILASILYDLDELEAARSIQEAVLEERVRTMPPNAYLTNVARSHLALTLVRVGDLARARALQEEIVATYAGPLARDYPLAQVASSNLAVTLARQELALADASGPTAEERVTRRARFREIALECARTVGVLARRAVFDASRREAEERCARLVIHIDGALSLASGLGAFDGDPALDRAAFAAVEEARGAGLRSAALWRAAARDPRSADIRVELRAASDALARAGRDEAGSEALAAARARREQAERELIALARASSAAMTELGEFDPAQVSAKLAADEAVVVYRRYSPRSVKPSVDVLSSYVLCAFVLRSDGRLARVELGSWAPVEAEVGNWRAAVASASRDLRGIAAKSAGVSSAEPSSAPLTRLVLAALLPELAGVKRVIFVLDDVLLLVPFDALDDPSASGSLLGERIRVETRATVTELVASTEPVPTSGTLVVLGDPTFESAVTTDVEREDALDATRASADAGILRGGAWEPGFAALPATRAEIRSIADDFTARFPDRAAGALVLTGEDASRANLFAHAPEARWLHVATHGWFAPESIPAWQDPSPIDEQLAWGAREDSLSMVRGMSPMLLCGLALAGASQPADASGQVPGLVTAEELSTLDLARCELAVLSACDTSVGERRLGQGLASLQRALQMAGARSVITSLWSVPDEATRDLMADFYRRVWIDRKPKARALWEAKMKLRNAKDAEGKPRYATRDWAAWVLTGAPD